MIAVQIRRQEHVQEEMDLIVAFGGKVYETPLGKKYSVFDKDKRRIPFAPGVNKIPLDSIPPSWNQIA